MSDKLDEIATAEFKAFIKSLPEKHWSKYDLSAARLGWDARNERCRELGGENERAAEICLSGRREGRTSAYISELAISTAKLEAENKRLQSVMSLIPELKEVLEADIECQGGCDHSVGICICGEIDLLSRLNEALEALNPPQTD